MGHRWTRLGPLTGVIAIVLAAITAIVVRDRPNADTPGDEVVAFYTDNNSSQTAGAILFALSAVFLVFFVGELRMALRRGEAHGGLSTVAFGGGVMMAIGLLIFAGLTFTLADSADSLDPAAAQALNAINENLFFPLVAGVATLFVASGIAIVRGAPLPAWLGWVAIVIGIVAMTPADLIALAVGGIWIVVVSIMLATGAEPGEPASG